MAPQGRYANTIPVPSWQLHGHWAGESVGVELWPTPDPSTEHVLGCKLLRVTCLPGLKWKAEGLGIDFPTHGQGTGQFSDWQEGELSSW